MKAYGSSLLCWTLLSVLALANVAEAASYPVDWLRSSAGNLTLDGVRQLPADRWSQVPPGETLNVGFDDADIWVRLTLPANQSGRYLEIGYPLLDYVQVHWFKGSQRLSSFETGDRLAFDSRPVPHRHFLFPVPSSAEPITAFIKVQSEGSVQVPIQISDAADLITSEQVDYGWQALFLGIMIAMAVYNAFVLTLVRNPAYFWYVLTVVASALVVLNFNGLLFQWFWPESPTVNRFFTAPMVSVNILVAAMFAISFMSLRKYSPWCYRVMQGVVGISVLGFFYGLFGDYQTSTVFVSVLAVLVTPLSFVIGLVAWRNGQVLAKYYVIAWFPFLLGHLVNAISKIGVIPRSDLTDTAPQIGVTLEVMLMSFALASRISLERKRRQAAQERTLEVQRQANQTLEARVQARTEELEQVNERLKALTITDGLTQVANRRRFDDFLANEFKRACRHQYPLSLILLDIDHFKRLNDNHGHLVGDDCLVRVASACSELIHRSSDLLARYGGEEFVVLLPDTPETGAVHVAEGLRKAVAATPMPQANGQTPLRLTISVGVASITPTRDHDVADLIRCADEALYAAKGAGRNLVMMFRASGSEEVESL
ncbi:diguanylate cyclase [Marinobacter sp. CHS3-4]|uniref:sensor domain-containing diguanylate cyclase n=1 Tax=Marinobacter sp. CHS3-4 TaxID=3045174 RepID=UPI0024B4CD73|nr:diguanylate cyclase [Marinobacter sp. CHS3-4]MDI9243754.1 diguanylate cyclase [Marinobacter sp. CHS3-4]